MPKLMTHLVANYPDPNSFEQALSAMLDSEVDFLEIQLPFSNPLADGPVIYEANRVAIQYGQTLEEILTNVNRIYCQKERKTKLLLMSYFTPIMALGLAKVVDLCFQNNFAGFVLPDLIFGSIEQQTLSSLCRANRMQLIPVISPLTKLERLEKIKLELEPNQVIYAMARSGRTGNQTDLTEIQPYLDFLQKNLLTSPSFRKVSPQVTEGVLSLENTTQPEPVDLPLSKEDYGNFKTFQLAIGFGIREKLQVEFLNQQGFIAVIGSEIIRRIQKAQQDQTSIYEQVTNFLNNLN